MTNLGESYTDVVDCGNASQLDLFRRARLWLVQAAADESLLLSDPQTGDLAGCLRPMIILPRSASSAGSLHRYRCLLVIECANRKYRATITRIDLDDNGRMQPISPQTYRQKAPEVYAELDKQLKGFLASLQQDVKGYKPF
nr:DUF4468 domain-containing protein [Spirosoma sp. KNUC1025]